MDDQRIIQLAQKIVDGSISEAELEEFNNWYYSDDGENYKVNSHDSNDELAIDMFRQVSERIGLQVKQRKLWPRIAGIAAAVAVIVFGIYFFNSTTERITDGNTLAEQDIAPGKVGATLTLANGKKIRLADAANGEIAKQAGISVTKTADGQLVYQMKENAGETEQINTLSTAKGETYILTLPDKSKVWLNAASSLTYTASLNERGKRVVRLSGEGYFEITKDKEHPFIVQTDNQEVEVLGTHFNVNSYKDETAVATTLIEGSVRVTSSLPQAKQSKILKPGEQALTTGNSIKVVEANIENVTDWKDGDFFLNRVNFKTAMRKIARWYDVEVIYDASVPDDIKSGGWISRENNLSAVLKSIASTGQVKFRIEGKKLYVSK